MSRCTEKDNNRQHQQSHRVKACNVYSYKTAQYSRELGRLSLDTSVI